jgi:primosomal protein N' (replication factor Y)
MIPTAMPYAEVAVARPFPEPLTYGIPAILADRVAVGHVVLVPLGSTGETGYVVAIHATTDLPLDKVKPISRLLDPIVAFDRAQLAFFSWIARYYLVPLGMVIHTALPSRMRARIVRGAEATQHGVRALTTKTVEGDVAQVLREIVSRPGMTARSIVRRLADELDKAAVERSVRALERAEQIHWVDREIGETRAMVRTVRLSTDLETARAAPKRLGTVQAAVLGALDEAQGELDLKDLVERFGSGARNAVKALAALEVVETGEREKRDALAEAAPQGPTEPPVLNDDQQRALDAICAAAGTYLLFGVTGAGKTEVFLGAARHTLAQGRQVLVLVPEIGLTPQLVGRFKARFGDDVAVLHSGLTGHQRLAEWRRIRAGEAPVAVGARSALFAPFPDLGLLVVDEEHDDSYKQDEGVPYSARDLAVVLGRRHDAAVVLATATPSLESWHNAAQGRYTLLELPKRATPRPVPKVELVDMTQMTWPEGTARPMFAAPVVEALRETFARGGKAIVLYNRRGYATQVQCTTCGSCWECPNCGIAMTLHKRIERMSCHYCGLSLRVTEECPVCDAPTQEELGKGTEQVEETLRELFPDVALARMDADTTSGRGAHERILSGFREGRTQLLVGTQIVAKGHDFPDVHTAVVVSADKGFRLPDFRAAERTFALLVQVAGRAGRGDTPGRVFVQTWKPDHYVLAHLDDVRAFLRTELKLRGTLAYPPFSRLCLVRLDGVDRRAVERTSGEMARALRRSGRAYPHTAVLGPAQAALPRLVGRWRYQIVLRGQQYGPFRAWLEEALPAARSFAKKGIRVSWDVDPRHLM